MSRMSLEEIRNIIFAPLPFDVDNFNLDSSFFDCLHANKEEIALRNKAIKDLEYLISIGDKKASDLADEYDEYVEVMLEKFDNGDEDENQMPSL